MTKKSRLAKLLTKMNSRRPLKTRRPRRLGVQQLETRKMLDGNDTFDEAFNIGSLADQTELDSDQLTTGFSINPVTDVDMFSFQALRGQRVEVEIDGDGSSPSHRIRLFSPDIRYDFIENLTAYSDGTLSFNATESSTFYVGVSEASNGSYSPITGNGDLVSPGARTGGFTLRVRLQNGTPPPPSIVDLQPESPIAPPTARPGSTIRPLIEIDNTGTGSASQFKVDFYLSTNTYISSFDTKLATVTRPGVAAGGSDSWIQDLAIPSDLSAGTYYLGMIVDADGLVDDVPSTSNIEYTSIIIENAPPPPPPSVVDLDPEIPVAPPSANTGNSIDVRVEVDNTGTGDAGQYDVDFYLSTNSYISSFDTKLATETRFGIAAGGSDSWSQRLTIPSDLAPGIYYLGIIVDADGLVDDVPGTSNVEYTQITILDIPTPPPPPPATNGDAVGFYNPNQAMFELRSHLGPNADVDRVSGQSVPANFIPLVGDWNGDGVETLGFYDPASSVFHLSNRSGSTSSDIRFQYGPSGFAGWTPLAGDWNGDGIDTIGFYQPDLSLFHLKDSFTAGASDQYFGFGPSGNAGWTPMVGDWNGDGVDTVGFYEPGQSLFHLKDSFTPGRSDQYFGFGPAFGGWTPLAGDWNGDGVDTIGLYDRTGSMFHLKDSFTHGASDHYVGWAASEFQGVPIVGRWGDSQNDPPVPFPEVPTYGSFNDWNLNLIGAPEAWAQGHTGDGVLVAVLDSGIDFNHPDLLQSLHRNYADPIDGIDNDGNGYTDDFIGYDFANGDEFPEDTDGHGTHVAGTIAAARNGVGATGVAYDAKILPVKVFGDGPFNADGYIDAIKYAIKMGADIINMSLGGGYDPAEEAAIQLAAQHDILVVAAAGNDGDKRATTPDWPARLSEDHSNVISVGSHTRFDFVSSFSNPVGFSGATQVDAPGSSIYSTRPDGKYGLESGTSMATPHVAGLAALTLSANPNLSAVQLRDLIIAGLRGDASGSDSLGMIDARTTVALAAARLLPNSGVGLSGATASNRSSAGDGTELNLDQGIQGIESDSFPAVGSSLVRKPSIEPVSPQSSRANHDYCLAADWSVDAADQIAEELALLG